MTKYTCKNTFPLLGLLTAFPPIFYAYILCPSKHFTTNCLTDSTVQIVTDSTIRKLSGNSSSSSKSYKALHKRIIHSSNKQTQIKTKLIN